MWKYTQRSWTSGELDPHLAGRQDLQAYFKGATTITNFLIHPQGFLMRRAGTFKQDIIQSVYASPYFTKAAANPISTLTVRLIPFLYHADESTYLLMIASPGEAARAFLCDRSGTYASGENPKDGEGWCTTTITAAQLETLSYCQSGDTIFLTDRTMEPMKIKRTMREEGNFILRYEKLPIGVYEVEPPSVDDITLTVSDVDGSGGTEVTVYYCVTRIVEGKESLPSDAVTATYKAPWQDGGKITIKIANATKDDQFRVYKKSQAGEYGLIGTIRTLTFETKPKKGWATKTTSGDTETTEVIYGEFDDNYITPDLTMGLRKDEKQTFTDIDGGNVPQCCALYQQRLVLAGPKSDPARIWMSETGDLYEFTTHETIREDDPIDIQMAATELPQINHILFFRELLAFTEGGEWLISPISGNAISYKTISAKQQSAIGCTASVPPLIVRDEVIFVSRDQKRIYATSYNYVSDGYESHDITLLSRHLFDGHKIISMAYTTKYVPRIECVLDNGDILACTYIKDENVCAWTKFEIKNLRGEKTITQVINPGDDCLIYLANDGENPCILVQASDMPNAETYNCEDLPYVDYYTDRTGLYPGVDIESKIETIRPEIVGDGTTIQYEIKNAKDVEIRTFASGPFSIRAHDVPAAMAVDAGIHHRTIDYAGAWVETESVDVRKVINGHNQRDGRIILETKSNGPLNILSISINYEIQPLSGSEG